MIESLSEKLKRSGTIAVAAMTALGLAGLLGAGAASAAANYPTAATLSSSGPTVFNTSPTDQPIANLVITELVANGVDAPASPNNYVCISLSGGASFVDNTSAAPTQAPNVTSTAGNAGGATITSGQVAFPVTAASSSPATYTLANLYVSGIASSHGPIMASATESQTATCSNSSVTSPPDVPLASSVSAYGVETYSQTLYGQTPDATTAAEFSAAVNCADGHPTANTAVVATDLDPYDALSAATLEGALNAVGDPTAMLITSQAAPGSDLLSALKADGVGTVYVVGGPDAISSTVISDLKSTPATICSGGTAIATSSDISVIGPIYGQTADDTAVAIDNQANTIVPLTNTLPAPASYNDTSGNATGSWTTGGKTAILVSDADWSDSMAVSGAAYQLRLPVILTSASSLGSQAAGELSSLGVKNVVVLGGQLAVANGVVTTLSADGYGVLRIAGIDATDTAQLLAQYELNSTALNWSSAGAHTALFAQGAYWSDALGSAALASAGDEPLFITEGPTSGLGSYTPSGLTAAGGLGIYNLQVLGGPLAVPSGEITAALTALAN